MLAWMQGGELFTFMRKRRRALRESWARFYAAAVVMGFGYLSSRDIVYRCVLCVSLRLACRKTWRALVPPGPVSVLYNLLLRIDST
jgi:hypothetical protein